MLICTLLLSIITSTAEINALSTAGFNARHTFALTGTVESVLYDNHCILADASGRTHIRMLPSVAPDYPREGDTAILTGYTGTDGFRQKHCNAEHADILGHTRTPEPEHATVRDIVTGKMDFRRVIVEGFVADAFRDDNDYNWNYLVLEDAGSFVYVTVPNISGVEGSPAVFQRTHVRLAGTSVPNHCGARLYIGPHIEVPSFREIKRLDPDSQPSCISSTPQLDRCQPIDIVRSSRWTFDGLVCGIWGGQSLLLEDDVGIVHRIDLDSDVAPPAVGTRIRATGFPETNLYAINLSKAHWENLEPTPHREAAPCTFDQEVATTTWRQLLGFHGHPAAFTGRVLTEATAGSGYRALLEENGVRLVVDASSCPELKDKLIVNARVRATGCGLIETENWRPGSALPALKPPVLILRIPDDIVILEKPSWWTPARLLIVVLALVAALIAFLIWNRMLNRLAERRGRQLLHEELANAAAQLKASERTRLAVELHDALSQTLTGIACHVDTANQALAKNPSVCAKHLTFTQRALDSCRTELRNCLWDLRSQTLEEQDANAAIRRTVLRHAGDAVIDVQFDVPRRKISDTTFHEILCILRELVCNAVRHGKARRIEVRGRMEGEGLQVTVRDDGRGFDPDKHPGSAEGHFGLQGVSERINRLSGTLDITSSRGRGASITFSFGIGK